MAIFKKNRFSFDGFPKLGINSLISQMPYLFFLGFLAIIYISNAHYAEKQVREIKHMQLDLKEMKWSYMTFMSERMYQSKESEVAKLVKPFGLLPHKKQPKKIKVPDSFR